MDKTLIRNTTKEILKFINKPKQFIQKLQEFLNSLIDTEATKNYQRIIPDTGKFYGVPKPILWILSSEIGKFIQKEPSKAKELLKIIWSEGSFEAKQIAGKSLEKFGPKNPEICLNFVTSVVNDLDNWSVCDCLAMYSIEPIVYSNPERVLQLSENWIGNNNKWVRRFGVVTLRGYKKIKITENVFNILDKVMKDEENDVRKAVAWVLREISKKNPDEVANFLLKWAKSSPNKDTKKIIRDGMKKLSKEEQNEIMPLLDL
ncbi:MAG: DNA alkylation repair protein [Candidatus Helarchaeota archaeon]